MSVLLYDVIQKYNYAEVTAMQLAELAGFNAKQQQLVKLFWDSTFNKNWLYLSDYLILNHLTNEIGKNAISHYYDQILKKYCIESEDYKEIKKDDELITNFDSLNLGNQNKLSKQGAKKHFAITGRCYKKLLMRASGVKGDEARDYYLKLEELVISMKDYISARIQYISQKQLKEQTDKVLALELAQKTIIDKKNQVIKGMKSLVGNTTIALKDEWLYITTTITDKEDDINKIGKANELISRLSQYNCGKTGDSVYYYVYFRKCHDATFIENTVRNALIKFKVTGKKDVFQVRYDFLERICDAAIDGQDNITNIYNELIQAASSDEYYNTKIVGIKKEIPTTPTIPVVAPIAPIVDNSINLDDIKDSDLDQIIKDSIGKYIIKEFELTSFNYDLDKNMDYKNDKGDSCYMLINWRKFTEFIKTDIKIKYKKITPFKTKFKTMVNNTETLKCRWK